MHLPKRRQLLSLPPLLGLLSCLAPLGAPAGEAWPARPVHIVVAYPAGGVSDAMARLLGERLAGLLGVAVVVENKAGASGAIAVDAVAKSAPDGYTLCFTSSSPLTLSPYLGRLPYRPDKDLAPVVQVMSSPVLLLATPATPVHDFRELLAQARRQPATLRWATAGQASLGHIMLAQLKAAAQVEITHVPYKGGGQQMTDALSGQFEVLSTNASPAVLQQIQAGRLRPLAVGASRRLEALPQVPTLAELGYPAANLASQFGLLAPAQTPPAVLQRINQAVNQVLRMPEVGERMKAGGNLPAGGTEADFARLLASEAQANAHIIAAAGIQAD
ncbi:MAG: tripartite tricarboxylate transporter substrate binding protein [Curvibacter sp.]|nr:tripartite tricarboxylate transporter substrate binding protein [Curvibacter sp.]